MKHNILRTLFSLVLIIGIMSCALFGIPDISYRLKESIVNTPTPDPLDLELSIAFFQYENEKIPSVDLSAITSFSWDRLYIFGPYTSYYHLNSKVGVSWMFVCSTDIDVLDETALLVFKRNSTVVHCLEYPTERYDFTSLATVYSDGIPIREALFILNEKGFVDLASNH